ncbi:hypothetical protein [Rhizorhapis sp. SPR117]|uniref:hypothetical protein n=1 Tax=Rhizorhapis sp. SPR117 TaxID=2912611 RepID=UPI001F2A1D57|nr:hypothetical protein [Rhizorhapis sp. SPR117]
MAIFPRPVSPKRAWIDLRDYFLQGRRHKVLFLLLSVAATWAIVWAFLIDAKTNIMPGPQIIYVQNWKADRSDADIIAQQKLDLERRIVVTKAKQAQFRKAADALGIEWRKEAKVGDRKEQEAIDRLRAKLDEMEAQALAKEQAAAASREAAR